MAATPTAMLKDEQQNLTWFLTLENVSVSEYYTNMCTVHGVQNVVMLKKLVVIN